MKFYKFKTVVGITLGSAAVISMAACGSGSNVAPLDAEADTSPITIAADHLEAKEVLFTMKSDEHQATPTPIEAGTLVKGSSTVIYYVTDDGTLRPFPDQDTFEAFGFSPQEVMVVDDDVLSAMPVDDALTRLLFDSRDYLYWVASGQRWQVNEWKRIVRDFPDPELATSHLDDTLQDRLPVHNSLSGKLLGQGDRVYYRMGRLITPVTAHNYNEAEVIDVPESALAAYTLQVQLKKAWITLSDDIQTANVRRGPGLKFDVIDTIDNTDRVLVRGRAENSNWLLIKYRAQDAWLAGDLVEDQYLLDLLPIITFHPAIPKVSESQPTDLILSKYPAIGVAVVVRDDSLVVVSVYDGGPAGRAGLEVGDILLEVDGMDASTLSLGEAITRIQGEIGAELNLMVRRPSTNERLGIAIVWGEVTPSAQTPTCHAQPIRGFGTVWENHPEVRQWLGCPFTNFRRNEHATKAAVQTFQHGWMLWLETDTVANVDPIYVFFEDNHKYLRFGDRELVDAHSFASTPQGFYKVGDRFAKVYWEELGRHNRQRLGYATNEARDSDGAFQEFEAGRMFWSGEADTIYVIYQSLNLDDHTTTSLQSWASYEDTFEDPSED